MFPFLVIKWGKQTRTFSWGTEASLIDWEKNVIIKYFLNARLILIKIRSILKLRKQTNNKKRKQNKENPTVNGTQGTLSLGY